jgi:dTDP-4-amino-4,6-dideoxygalactose transaminase
VSSAGPKVPLSQLTLSPAQRAAADRVLGSGWLSMGPETAATEASWCERSGVAHAFLTASCTASLWLALAALEVGPGDEVIVPSLTFVADANVVVRLGATPVFADIESAERPLLDPASVAAVVTPATKAVVPVHYAGYQVDLSAIRAAAPGVAVVDDCAHAPGPPASGTWPGGEGDISCYSFFSNKNLGVGEGGLVSTNDPELARRLKLLRSHGMDSLTWDRHRGHASSYDVLAAGMNFRPSEIVAALVGSGLDGLPEENERRRQHLAAYRAELAEHGVEVIFDAGDDTTGHLAVALAGARRDEVREALGDAGIQSSVHYPPIHRFTYYREAAPARNELPGTEAAGDGFVTLPLWGGLPEADRRRTVEIVGRVLTAGA